MIIERKPSWFYLRQREISLLWNGAGWNEPLFLLFLPFTQMIDIGVVLFPPVFYFTRRSWLLSSFFCSAFQLRWSSHCIYNSIEEEEEGIRVT